MSKNTILRPIHALLAFLFLFAASLACAQQVTPDTVAGDTVTHPGTGVTATVVAVIDGYAVLTDNNDVILMNTEIGTSFTLTGSTTTVTIVDSVLDPVTGFAVQITVDPNDPNNPPNPPEPLVVMDVAQNVDQDVADAIAAAAGATGDPETDIDITIPAGNINVFHRRRVGADGDDGSNGYGLQVCDPTGILGCAIIGYSGTNGEDGKRPSALTYTLTEANNGNIQSVSNGYDGVSVVSVGGDGGDGGDAYGNFDGRRGGNAGPGGTVTVTSNVDIATSGNSAHGMFGQSRAGESGDGGSGYIFGGGGDGGTASQGGPVTLTNNRTINTLGNGSHGMFAQSVGGSAGSGGSSWGVVGSAGSSRLGGHGGTATVTNNGDISTSGTRSHGMMAQSVGGTGGDGGDAGGLVAFGGSGSAGGNGGAARANLGSLAQILTTGARSIGQFAQSIGGGGGDGGVGGAVVAFGGTGSAGGSGGAVTVTNATGSSISTEGYASHGILAQSIGGGGGNGATGGGVVALGGAGSGAGNGGTVTVTTGARIATAGEDARGIFAQSVGGGGGSANGTGGLVSIGGRSGAGGSGGAVNVNNSGTVTTEGLGGDAIYAQSIGGGGGSGAASGGAVSIGGGGSRGGSASTVTVTNSGTLVTEGNTARGVFAQSVGGGGGTGGHSGGLVAIGGSGSRASHGNRVTVTNNGSIATSGVNSSAIHAQSIGGGGGDGGTTGGVLLTIGGSGAGGGNANIVTVESNRDLTTTGDDSHGIFAQSVGGGGGNGGNAASGSAFAGVAIGGRGATGGNGSTVVVRTNEYELDLGQGPVMVLPEIRTSGDRASGIFAQSVGGGGGNGGFAIQGTGGTFFSASVAVGGSAGPGSTGGRVDLDASAAITTEGQDADGVLAQSIGGGGGNGGFAISGSGQFNPAGGVAIAVGVGGTAGGGGNGNTVEADFAGSIHTTGELSEGIIAQSLGGGGGNGGFSIAGALSGGGVGSGAVNVGVGGTGGSGGTGGTVTATSDANVVTEGDDSRGVLFQSVGGGGGNGGYSISLAASAGGVGSGGINVGIGGSGSTGGNGGSVTGTVNGSVRTAGESSTAVTVQSVGGGGGAGAFNIGVAGSAAATGTGALNVGVGGSGARGGAGGAVVANVGANVLTTGESSTGVVVQSVGGGGGDSGFSVTGAIAGGGPSGAVNVSIGGGGGGGGHGGTVTADLTGNTETTGEFSTGVIVQSVGGGGGNALANIGLAGSTSGIGVSFGLGGAPGDAGNGADVNVTQSGNITTNGTDAAALIAQSIGGGGGNAGLNIASGYSSIGKLDVGIGRVGGTGGTGGAVTATTDGVITTLGDNSIGVLAQSVGNGGGKSGGHSFGVGVKSINGALGLSLGLEGGQGGTADDVSVTTHGRVQTTGLESHAVFAQSIGGGGGIGGMSVLPVLLSSTIGASIGGAGGTGGTSGLVTVDNFAEVLTMGDAANGIFAQSVGGGGGNGGIAATGGIQTGPVGGTLTMGGTGGTGAVSGNVAVTNAGIVDTRGFQSNGIFAQSLGGGGGNGGLTFSGIANVNKTPATDMNLSVVIGGSGGTGADAGNTSVINEGIVATSGDEANGIFAQSVGGGGGNGGLTMNLLFDNTQGGGQVGITVGGSGGTGGAGGEVTVDNRAPADGGEGGIVFTTGNKSHGILAQSIGGGGGNGSSVIALNGTKGGGNLQIGVAIGGSGGTGGVGGEVTVNNEGMIETQGDESHGVYAQSIGGGGGNGGMTLAGNIVVGAKAKTSNGKNSFTPLYKVGGDGGAGNDGGTVVVNNSGNILTSGANSHGIVAQSIGGGGGDAGIALGKASGTDPVGKVMKVAGKLFSSLGAEGGAGGLGGDVTVNHTGDITTLGEGSEAIVAQSINGGGGGMRVDFTGITSIADQFLAGFDPDFEGTRYENDDNGDGALIRFDLGGHEVSDSAGGAVTVNTTGTINTAGADSIGQSIQGIGGGGGVLNFRLSLDETAPEATKVPLVVRLGGSEGAGNDGSDLDVEHTGGHLSNGARAHGALVQSIGGGGGRGTMNIEVGAGDEAEVGLVLGGRDGTDEAGGAVAYRRDGVLVTTGNQALGTAVQSIGGGGGVAAYTVSEAEPAAPLEAATGSTEKSAGPAQRTSGPAVVMAGNAAATVNASITLGAQSGTGLDGGDLDVVLSGDLLTQGTHAHGLFMQSIGAGGGLAYYNGVASTLDVSLGSAGGAVGNGGAISLSNAGNVWTEGLAAHGVFLQSIGGGGGAVYTSAQGTLPTISLNDTGVGDGGAISFSQTGNISATGAGSYGVFAQSLGGGGGVVNDLFAGTAGGTGRGGSISLDITGDVMALADGMSAIWAQSDGADGGGDISISVTGGGSVIGGLGGAGITILGGNNNSILIDGVVGTLDNLDGVAITTGESVARGNDTVFNFGTTFGSLSLGNGDNFFRNEEGAVFYAGSLVQLDIERTGSDAIGTLFNFGTLTPGGPGETATTIVEGNFEQGATGLFLSELDLSRSSTGQQVDRLSITGSASVDGTIDVAMSNFGYVMPGEYRDVLFGAAGGINMAPTVMLSGIPTSAVANFQLDVLNGTDMVLSSNISFAPDGLNNNLTALGDHINAVQLAGGSAEFAPLASTLFFTQSMDELVDLYNGMSPYLYADMMAHTLLANAQFGERLVSCFDRRGDVGQQDRRCWWLRLSTQDLTRDATADYLDYEDEGLELSGGMEFRMDGDRSFGWGLSYLQGEGMSAGRAASDSDVYQLGLMYRQPLGRFTFSASATGGTGSFESMRLVEVPDLISEVAEASPDMSFYSVRGGLSHEMLRESWYLRTALDLAVNYVNMSSFTETGGSIIALDIPSTSDTFLSVYPSLEIGGQLKRFGRSARIRPYARIGYMGLGMGGAPQLQARFAGSPADVEPFLFESGLERDYAQLALGIDVLSSKQNLLRFEANGIAGDATTQYGLEGSWSFFFD